MARLRIVVARIAVGERVDVGEDQAFFGIGDVGVVVDRMHQLFLIRDAHQSPALRAGLIG